LQANNQQLTKTLTIMKTKKIVILVFLLAILGTSLGYGQAAQENNANYDRFSVGLGLGLLSPFTDVMERSVFPTANELTFGGSLMLNYAISPALSLRGQFLFGSLKGNDIIERNRFESGILEGNVQGLVSLIKLLHPQWEGNTRFDLYAGLGLGLVNYRTEFFHNNILTAEPTATELVIPLSIGMRYNLTPRIDIFVESGFRIFRDDKLDGLNRPFSTNDAFNFTNAGIAIKLGRNNRSLAWASVPKMMYPGDVTRMDEITSRVNALDTRVTQTDRSAVVDAHARELQQLRTQVQEIQNRQAATAQQIEVIKNGQPADFKPSVAGLLSVFFRLNSAVVDNINYERVAAAARFLAENPNMNLEIIGHTDISGPAAFNLGLSERRARAVYNILVNDFNVEATRLSISFKGEDQPFADPRLRINRRVEFRVVE